jgi:hypothetical protein
MSDTATTEQASIYKREYYDKFREKNLDKIQEKQQCSTCGGSYTYYNKSRHIRSAKHIACLRLHPTEPEVQPQAQ